MRKAIKFTVKLFWYILGILFFPVFVLGWFLHKASKLILAMSYMFMLDMSSAYKTMKRFFW